MSSYLVTFGGVLCLALAVAAHATHERRSCGLGKSVVCVPTACSLVKCLLFNNATCVDDKCGCEGRFFTYIEKEKTYQDVTKMCTSGNVVLNFANFTDSALRQSDETPDKPRLFHLFFRQFNILVTELLADLVVHLRMAAEKHPVQTNIDLAKKASITLENLKNMTEEHRAMCKAKVHIKDSDTVRDEDEDAYGNSAKITAIRQQFEKRDPAFMATQSKGTLMGARDEDEDEDASQMGRAVGSFLQQNPALMAQIQASMKGTRDEDEDEDAAQIVGAFKSFAQQSPAFMAQVQAMNRQRDEDEDGAQIAGAFKNFAQNNPVLMAQIQAINRQRDEYEDDMTDSSAKLFKAHTAALRDILKDGNYIPVGASGKPGVLSDEDVTTTLKELQGRGFFSSIVPTLHKHV